MVGGVDVGVSGASWAGVSPFEVAATVVGHARGLRVAAAAALAGEGAGCLRGSERKGGLRGEQRDNESPQSGLGCEAAGEVEDGRKGRRRDEGDMHLTRGQVFKALKPEDKRNG